MGASGKRTLRLVISLLLGITVGALLFAPLDFPSYTPFQKAVLDAGHVPLFFMLTIAVALLLPRGRSRPAAVLGIIFLIVLFTELAQQYTGRTFSLRDIISDMLGAVLAVVGLWAWKRRRGAFAPSVFFILAVFVCGLSLARPLQRYKTQIRREMLLPVLSDFDDPEDLDFWRPLDSGGGESASIRRLERHGRGMLEVSTSSERWAGVEYDAGLASWKGHEFLELDLFNPGERLRLTVRIDDNGDTEDFTGRFNKTFEIAPGRVLLQISMEAIKRGPRDRLLDTGKISRMLIFTPEAAPATFFIDRASLVPAAED